MSLCDQCTDPGMCCREIVLNVESPYLTGLETLAWLASIEPSQGEIGLPFIPLRRQMHPLTDESGPPCPVAFVWVYTCGYLTLEGRCGNYEGRPKLCRDFTPGVHIPCAMTDLDALLRKDVAHAKEEARTDTDAS